MSNRRRPATRNRYRAEYLTSPQWHARRDRWFRTAARRRQPLRCVACGRPGTVRTLELHHLDYHGVRNDAGRWIARERHRDLLPLHPGCHELLHRLIDRDTVLSRARSRRAASLAALVRLRRRIHALVGEVAR